MLTKKHRLLPTCLAVVGAAVALVLCSSKSTRSEWLSLPSVTGGAFLSNGLALTSERLCVGVRCVPAPDVLQSGWKRRSRGDLVGARAKPKTREKRNVVVITALPREIRAFVYTPMGFMLRLTALNFCKLYMALLVLRTAVMWFPNLNPYRQPFYSVMQLTDPYLNLFRGWMPPAFGVDLSSILAFVVMQAAIDSLSLLPY